MQVLYYFIIALLILFRPRVASAQLKWVNVDSLYQPLPTTVHVFRTTDSLEGKPNIAYYVSAELKDRHLDFTADTTYKRRLTPKQFYERNDKPLLVVNCTFFSFETNQNLNVVVRNGKLSGYNIHSIEGRGRDTFTYRHPFRSAIGISKKRNADIAWIFSDSLKRFNYAAQIPAMYLKDSISKLTFKNADHATSVISHSGSHSSLKKWKMQTAVGGGPVLLQNGEIKITNEEEMMFAGKRINEKESRTAMGYTKDRKLIILVVQGRFPGIAEGATLIEEALIFKDLGCWEALNLDGGGSSCMLVNGKETIKPSSNGVQRPVPAVFLIKMKL